MCVIFFTRTLFKVVLNLAVLKSILPLKILETASTQMNKIERYEILYTQ